MADPRFIHLRVHSDFSMVDGLQKIGPIVSAAAAPTMGLIFCRPSTMEKSV